MSTPPETITELVTFPTATPLASFSSTQQALLSEIVIDQPGLIDVTWAVDARDNLYWFQNWTSISAHDAFTKAPVFPSFFETVTSFCKKPEIRHAQFEGELDTVLSAPAVGVYTLTPDDGWQWREAVKEMETKDGFKSAAAGRVKEVDGQWALLIGWDGVKGLEELNEGSFGGYRAEAEEVIVMKIGGRLEGRRK